MFKFETPQTVPNEVPELKEACRMLGRRIWERSWSPFWRIRFQRKELRVMIGKKTEVVGGW